MTPSQIIEKYVKSAQEIENAPTLLSRALLVFIGIPGSGKTTLSMLLAEILPAVRIASDDVKIMLYGDEKYDVKEFFRVQQLAIADALKFTNVISDANSDKQIYRDQLKSIAQQNGLNCFFIKCEIDIEAAIERVSTRSGRFKLSRKKILEYYYSLEEPNDALILNTSNMSIGECINDILYYIIR